MRVAKKTLVDWPLGPDEVALAERNRVHLRTLAAPRVHASEPEEAAPRKGESSFELTRLELDPIDADLKLSGPGSLPVGDEGVVHLGTSRVPAIGQLVVRVDGEWKEAEFSYGVKPLTK